MKCTYNNCNKPIFGDSLCQRHYRSYHVPCILCNSPSYCKTLCMYHYRLSLKTNQTFQQPLCSCGSVEFVKGKCISCFKEEYRLKTCIYVECENPPFRSGLCCMHYFRKRRNRFNTINI